MKTLFGAIALLTLAACAPMNGVLTVKAANSDPAMLHDVYTVMKANGFLMKKPESLETYDEEKWTEAETSTTGAFMDPTFKRLVAVVMYFKNDKELFVFFDEQPTGFSPEGQARTDKAVRALKQQFGDKIAITERRNYKGAE